MQLNVAARVGVVGSCKIVCLEVGKKTRFTLHSDRAIEANTETDK